MPTQQLIINDGERALLEQVRLQQGLTSIEETAEWLAKSRLRRQSKQMTGRGRALYVVVERKPE
ncbi:hypothetical protein H8K32_19165 [Undibacterium jejuense]|uniref:Uncharacterized protein n=1 Tax=Undibacterium jejuense TaxID=1344949 RepID=A0A923HKP6_9BURK|nr:hypothetical protein [Undibacterium jejuense]MBC3864228.1 hypothetical protein [Undibacterium jejuense]